MTTRKLATCGASLLLFFTGCSATNLVGTPPPTTSPTALASNPTGSSESLQKLEMLVVDDDLSDVPPYDRDIFGTGWAEHDGCDLRADLLKETSTVPVEVNDNCTVLSGDWEAPFVPGEQHLTDPRQVDIDHIRPAASGFRAGLWRLVGQPGGREELARFYNYRPNLLPVSASVNRSKGDAGPSEFVPADASAHCIYGHAWVDVSLEFDLSVTSNDKKALAELLDTC